jgi:hypothetical protein
MGKHRKQDGPLVDGSGGAGADGPTNSNTMSERAKRRAEEALEYKDMSPEEAADAYVIKHKDRISREAEEAKTMGLSLKIPMEQLIEMSRDRIWIKRYLEPAKKGEPLVFSFEMQYLMEEELGFDFLLFHRFLEETEGVLVLLEKHLKRAKGKERAKLKKTITQVEKTRQDGMQLGDNGLTIQSRNWYRLQPALFYSLKTSYPDFVELPSFYMSGALLLNKSKPHTIKGGQLSFFDDLEPHEVEAIAEKGQVAIEEVTANGIKRGLAGLTGPEHRLLLALSQLLHERSSETFDPNSKDLYTGDGTHVNGWPYIWVSPYDLALTCKGETGQRGVIGGNDTKAITETVEKLSKREFLLSFQQETETTRKGRATVTTDTISTQGRIIQILNKTKRTRDKETGELLDDSTQIAIGLNPIFRHGIAKYFVEWPSDTIARLEETKEGQRIPESVWVLLDYIQTRRSNAKGKEEEVTDTITANAFFQKLQPKDMEQKKPKQAKEKTDKALEHCKRSGFLRDYQTGKNKSGEPIYILKIPKETPPFLWGSLQ